MTSPADSGSAPQQTSLHRVVAAAAGGAIVTWLLWHFAFSDSISRSTVQAALIFAVMIFFISFDRWTTRRRRH
ncbi:hypothetical protein [Kineococcus sp. R86509]|uniref:hypothetical protein n=1 Tax=Kineococcus sp. R86509 TaxID=3093851 RepID=UPI0036D414FC